MKREDIIKSGEAFILDSLKAIIESLEKSLIKRIHSQFRKLYNNNLSICIQNIRTIDNLIILNANTIIIPRENLINVIINNIFSSDIIDDVLNIYKKYAIDMDKSISNVVYFPMESSDDSILQRYYSRVISIELLNNSKLIQLLIEDFNEYKFNDCLISHNSKLMLKSDYSMDMMIGDAISCSLKHDYFGSICEIISYYSEINACSIFTAVSKILNKFAVKIITDENENVKQNSDISELVINGTKHLIDIRFNNNDDVIPSIYDFITAYILDNQETVNDINAETLYE